MRKVLAAVMIVLLAVPVVAQETQQPAQPQPEVDVLKQAVELDTLKKQIAQLQSQLKAATADEQAEARKKNFVALSESMKKEYGPECAKAGGKWAWMQTVLNNQTVTLVGCVAK